MKKLLFLSFIIVLTGCASTTGLKTAGHNGKLYYIPPQCETYNFYNEDPDTLHCMHQGNYTGRTLQPADEQQVRHHIYQQEMNRRAAESINQNMKNMMPKTTNTNCYNIGSMLNCQSTTY